MNISNIQGYTDLPGSKKDSCSEFIQSIISSQFPDENVEIKRITPYADGVEVTFCKDGEEYTFCNITPDFFKEVTK